MQPLPIRIAALIAALIACSGCGPGPREPAPAASPSEAPAELFRDSSNRLERPFVHAQSRGGTVSFLPETLGPGVASLDFDGDGLRDLFFVQGSGDTNGKDPATVPPACIYRNKGEAGLEEVGEVSGAGIRGWGQACLAADLDNDGYEDLLVTGYRDRVRLLVNNGDGTFRESGERAGLPPGNSWWSFATAIDHDRDGLLDLYVGAYVEFGEKEWVENPPLITFVGVNIPQTMAPSPYRGAANVFLVNRGNGRFTDETARLGVADRDGRGMGALAADLDDDGWPDLFVANDVSPCALFQNTRGGFREIAARAWINESRGSMGLALGDPDGDGKWDIACTHWVGDVPALYASAGARGKPLFRDAADQRGLSMLPRDLVGWAVGFPDVDNDGRDDLLIVHGHTNYGGQKGVLAPQLALFLDGQPDGTFRFRRLGTSPSALKKMRVGRGAAFTDIDNDGFVDLAVGVNNGPAELWTNVGGGGGWIGAELVATRGNRVAIGASLIVSGGTRRRIRQIASGESFFSTNDRRVLVGLGAETGPFAIEVHWPSGHAEVFERLSPRAYHRLVEGGGRAL